MFYANVSHLWLLPCILIGVVIALRGDYTHYTWWMVTEFWTVTLLSTLDYGHVFAITFLVQSVLVIVGVVAMSSMECSMLVTTASELGWMYIPLNFLVHYVPSLVIIGYPPRVKITTFREQNVIGISIFVSYALVNNAIDVYGCNFQRGIVPILFSVFSLALLTLETPIIKALTRHNYV